MNTTLYKIRAALRYPEVATRYGVHPQTVRNWVASGSCPPPRKIDGSRRFLLSDLERWEATGCEPWCLLESLPRC